MTQYDNNNSGALFKNKKKTSEKDADYSGTSEINNVKYRIWARLRKTKAGETFMSLSYAPENADYKKTTVAPVVEDLDDSIPF